ncbi:unnamed protein product [Vitrella brassicaformis CCMP3155]|uniref:PARP catalytic domain-containing protein n=1 Tax=Vitrella brassicaformis (strain CCMP3155) TaxID=1169540 RepID=A0A0G4FFV8_VITBC|nr:unnamed protein product [Vitrella brassicaformis CCMP3155]|eukprot:CEM11739.1 unnamed protein product [Vitrella brassicaformis CCMP3155]
MPNPSSRQSTDEACFRCKGDAPAGCGSCRGTGKTAHHIVYHGTNTEASKNIDLDGFSLSLSGMFGQAFYVTADRSKSVAFARRKVKLEGGQGVVYTLLVDVGNMKQHNASGPRGVPVTLG